MNVRKSKIMVIISLSRGKLIVQCLGRLILSHTSCKEGGWDQMVVMKKSFRWRVGPGSSDNSKTSWSSVPIGSYCMAVIGQHKFRAQF